MKKVGLLMLAVFFMPLLGTAGASVEVSLLNPTDGTFVRGTGSPITETRTFPGNSGSAKIIVYNGGTQDDLGEKVSSSIISVNGAIVFFPSEFNQNVLKTENTINLVEGSNSIEVQLKGKPGGKIRICILQSIESESAAVIDNQGGIIEVSNKECELFGTKIIIPPGALLEPTIISIDEYKYSINLSPDFIAAGPYIKFLPEGINFQKPVQISLPYYDTDGDGIIDGTEDYEYYTIASNIKSNGEVELFYKIEQDFDRKTISFEVGHFTVFAVIMPYDPRGRFLPEIVYGYYDEIKQSNYIEWRYQPYFGKPTMFKVYWGTNPNVSKSSEFGGLTEDYEFLHTRVVPGFTYYYRVCAVYGDLSGSESALGNEYSIRVENQFSEGIIPDTGQTKCYNNTDQIPCPAPGQAFYGQDGNYQGIQMAYQLSGDGLVVSDLNTGLMWQQADGGVFRNRADANEHCKNLILSGYSDWRLPSRHELLSIVDYSGSYPAINPVFSWTQSGDWGYAFYLSSDSLFDDPRYAWYVFLTGLTGWGRSDISNALYNSRCVRGEPLPASSYTNNGNGTITDTSTGLMWQQADSGQRLSWQSGISYCEQLNLAGYADWRMPNIRELLSLVDLTRSYPAINPLFSCSYSSNYWDDNGYWSGTTNPSYPLNAWFVFFNVGHAFPDAYGKNSNLTVRCVRGGP